MLELNIPINPKAAMFVATKAVETFPFDHRLRRFEVEMATRLSGQLPPEQVELELIKGLTNDPHAVDMKVQLSQIRAIINQNKLH